MAAKRTLFLMSVSPHASRSWARGRFLVKVGSQPNAEVEACQEVDRRDYTGRMFRPVPFHPIIAAWLRRASAEPAPVQALGWPAIADGRDVLLAAPTGSGKTLAAFLFFFPRLLRQTGARARADRTEIVSVSPLKALSNDIRRNLEEPLGELAAVAVEMGVSAPAIRTAVRTGDTSAAERRQGAQRPPHGLVP